MTPAAPAHTKRLMASRRYHILDVFTDTALAGNPLAVVLDAEGLDGAAMQRIATEFNLSETVFVLPPRDPINFARLRIFTPAVELPFAGHPTVGTAVLLATLRAPDLLRAGEVGLVLEEGIGAVACTARHRRGEAAHARFEVPQLAAPWNGEPAEAAQVVDLATALAAAFGLRPADIAGGGRLAGHAPSRFTAGVPFTFVPLADRDALGRARLQPDGGGARQTFYLYADDPQAGGAGTEGAGSEDRAGLARAGLARAGLAVRARMLARGLGVAEDPATGSAAAAFAGVLVAEAARLGTPLPDGDHDCRIRQGVEMGRPSLIGVSFGVAGGRLASTTVGGHAVIVGDGVLHL